MIMLTYYEYSRNTMSPCTKDNFRYRVLRWKTLEEMVVLDYKRVYLRWNKRDYEKYCEWCYENKYSPFSRVIFNSTPFAIFDRKHSVALRKKFSQWDKDYILSQKIYHTERKWSINQYFVLWWKLFLKRKYVK